ncbi:MULTISPECIES: glycerate kinase type-2 family protein [Agrobacterium tumefaciens complex]|uniref:glycerate kinase type-2 family protein n=1 Tax=Agrobacterium tumefaciens complex TaxID=1183400 RepID=UPI0011F2B860|nr:glycerate kinase [Agrobacterium tumefaciens]KAA1233950.1 glycerate kinase [Agrobacterium tumefaciens]MCW8061222.1 glycerate kinase [Agrobacterium tumefaciens]MCW8146043.1 glycerate kinase [Agrobacterium tumefaciens]MQB40274.1 glycerate kinase [Agrobacterium tumefaciens]NSX87443.1 glycerate kinase [Agrobacterium tumefaciens]
MIWNDASACDVLRRIFDAAVASADPAKVVASHLPERPKGRCVVIGAGKASAAMAAALDTAWSDVDLTGIVVTRYGHAVPAGRIEIIEASHPVPDEMSVEAATRIMAAVSGLGSDDLVIALISGGGSSLLVSPAGRMTLDDKKTVNRVLLASGATISEMNTVRRQLSGIKGGRLAQAAYPARVVSLVISDVPGDGPSEIASGPTVANPTTVDDAREIVSRYRLNLPETAVEVLANGGAAAGRDNRNSEVRMIASPGMALFAAAQTARSYGLTSLILGDALQGEAREVGTVFAGIALSARQNGNPIAGPAVILSGGETSVSLPPDATGRGGRNTEFLLSLAIGLNEADGIWAIAGDTDGIDGVEDAAGAIVTPTTLSRLRQAGITPRAALSGHDSYTAFKAIDDLVVTGPTLTNVNDIRAILIG